MPGTHFVNCCVNRRFTQHRAYGVVGDEDPKRGPCQDHRPSASSRWLWEAPIDARWQRVWFVAPMPKPIFKLLALAALAAPACCSKPAYVPKPLVYDERELDRLQVNRAFGPGEKLYYDIQYGLIHAGTSSAVVEQAPCHEGDPRLCLKISTTAETTPFFDLFYEVRDRIESRTDARGLYSWHFEQVVAEGRYHAHRLYTYDPRHHSVVFGDRVEKIPPFTQDALSLLYYVRSLDLVPGQASFAPVFADKKQYLAEIRVLRPETITVAAGTFSCVVVEPVLQSVGVFVSSGRILVWLSDDARHLPVQMQSSVVVGAISVELSRYELGQVQDQIQGR